MPETNVGAALPTILRWATPLTDFPAPAADREGDALVYPRAPGLVAVHREPGGCAVTCRYSPADPMPPLAVGVVGGDGEVVRAGRLDRTGRVSLPASGTGLCVRIAPVVRDARDVAVFRALWDAGARKQLELAEANVLLPREVRLQALLAGADLERRVSTLLGASGAPRPGPPVPVWERLAELLAHPPRAADGPEAAVAPAANATGAGPRALLPWSIAVAASVALVALSTYTLTHGPRVETVKSPENPSESRKDAPVQANNPPAPKPGGIVLEPLAESFPRPPLQHLDWLDENRFSTAAIAKEFSKSPALRSTVERIMGELKNVKEPELRDRFIAELRVALKVFLDLRPAP